MRGISLSHPFHHSLNDSLTLPLGCHVIAIRKQWTSHYCTLQAFYHWHPFCLLLPSPPDKPSMIRCFLHSQLSLSDTSTTGILPDSGRNPADFRWYLLLSTWIFFEKDETYFFCRRVFYCFFCSDIWWCNWFWGQGARYIYNIIICYCYWHWNFSMSPRSAVG